MSNDLALRGRGFETLRLGVFVIQLPRVGKAIKWFAVL